MTNHLVGFYLFAAATLSIIGFVYRPQYVIQNPSFDSKMEQLIVRIHMVKKGMMWSNS